ncbi:LytTR family DNA-binding domain-containing protein [Mucilaginibacter gossypii]|uniref:LytR/AlgR family response regulator transcription factor n=1 Tax=Mucilaginibacter gossypii TaxID=551996 RepID=UPI001CB90949|nr:LytTR family DNA-binding domain-containing protein [Mucilaginibacter gossypii]QTE39747.2 LytTR family DNA-binding domain-containing protein [Mucilaginibacter gossypii]
MNCYVVDDENHSIDIMSRYILKTPGLLLAGVADNPVTALGVINNAEEKPDVIFVDIEMSQFSGITFSEMVDRSMPVVFITASPDYAIQAFERNAYDYLLKPITYERFLKSIEKVKDRWNGRASIKENNDDFYVKCDIKGKVVRIEKADIIYVESLNNYVMIHTIEKKHITYLSMKEIESYLPASEFLRIHKSYIINLKKIISVEGNMVVLRGNHSVILGTKYRTLFFEALKHKLLASKRGVIER